MDNKVPPEVQYAMRKSLKKMEIYKTKKKRGVNINMQFHDVDDGQDSPHDCVSLSQKKMLALI